MNHQTNVKVFQVEIHAVRRNKLRSVDMCVDEIDADKLKKCEILEMAGKILKLYEVR